MIRWGILGAAEIAKKNWKAIWNSQNGEVVAVASRDRQRAEQFIQECQKQARFKAEPRVLGAYEELIAARDIDAVYIPLPTALRKRWVLRAAEAGKHIVCEKPCAVTVADLEEMLEACRRHRVQFVDGVMFVHSRRLERVRERLRDPVAFGAIKRITSAFSFKAANEFFNSNIRVQSELEPHGCLGDLGWYCIRFALWVMDWQLPIEVSGRTLTEFTHSRNNLPVPTEFSGELFFADGVSSSFYCSFMTCIEQGAIISGTNGNLRVPDFVLPFSGKELLFETETPVYEVRGCDFEMQPNTRRFSVEEHSHSHPMAQETSLFRNFAAQVESGSLNPSWPEMALKTQQVLGACRESASREGRVIRVALPN